MRVLGIDPGLTRCGLGVVDVAADRRARLVHVETLHTMPGLAVEQRLVTIAEGIRRVLAQFRPDSVALERVFAQHNLRTVMGTAQVSGVALVTAAEAGLSVGLHTPTQVKAAVTGYGAAEKAQVGAMIARILGLSEIPRPADSADALALAICHAWAGESGQVHSPETGETPAQRAWRAAERTSRSAS